MYANQASSSLKSYITTAVPPTTSEVSEVEREMNRIGNSNERVSNLLTMLEQRMLPLIRAIDNKADGCTPESVCDSPMGQSLRQVAYSVEAHERRLESLLGLLCI